MTGEMRQRIFFLAGVAIALSGLGAEGRAVAGDPPPAAAHADSEDARAVEPPPFERTLEFIESSEPLELLYDPDGPIPDQRYAATFDLVESYWQLIPDGPSRQDFVYSRTSFTTRRPPARAIRLQDLADLTPESLRPSRDLIRELGASSDLHFFVWFPLSRLERVTQLRPTSPHSIRIVDPVTREQVVTAATAEQARHLVETLFTILDDGLSRECFQWYTTAVELLERFHDSQQASLERAQPRRERLAALQPEYEALQKHENVTEEAIARLLDKQRMIAVNLAGINARIEACDKLLADRANMSPSRIEQVETVKITAEIELVGLKAEEAAIDEIIGAGRRRLELAGEISKLTGELNRISAEASLVVFYLSRYRRAVDEGWAYVGTGPITIRPIRWVPGDKED